MRLSVIKLAGGVTQGPKYMYQKVVPKYRMFRLNEPEKYGTGPINLLKNAYGEQPTVCLSMLIGLFGIFLWIKQYQVSIKFKFFVCILVAKSGS